MKCAKADYDDTSRIMGDGLKGWPIDFANRVEVLSILGCKLIGLLFIILISTLIIKIAWWAVTIAILDLCPPFIE